MYKRTSTYFFRNIVNDISRRLTPDKSESRKLSKSSALFLREASSRLWNRFSVDFTRVHSLWTTRGFFAESAQKFSDRAHSRHRVPALKHNIEFRVSLYAPTLFPQTRHLLGAFVLRGKLRHFRKSK